MVEIAKVHPLGPLVWAATAKSQFGPGRIIEEIRRNARSIGQDELRAVRMMPGGEVVGAALIDSLEKELARAERYVITIAPIGKIGALFIDANERPIEADEAMLSRGEATALYCDASSEILPAV